MNSGNSYIFQKNDMSFEGAGLVQLFNRKHTATDSNHIAILRLNAV